MKSSVALIGFSYLVKRIPVFWTKAYSTIFIVALSRKKRPALFFNIMFWIVWKSKKKIKSKEWWGKPHSTI